MRQRDLTMQVTDYVYLCRGCTADDSLQSKMSFGYTIPSPPPRSDPGAASVGHTECPSLYLLGFRFR